MYIFDHCASSAKKKVVFDALYHSSGLAGLKVMYPTCYFRALQYQRTLLEEVYVVFYGFFQIFEFQKVDLVYLFCARGIVWARPFNKAFELWATEGDHATTGVMINSNFTGAQQTLGDDEAS